MTQNQKKTVTRQMYDTLVTRLLTNPSPLESLDFDAVQMGIDGGDLVGLGFAALVNNSYQLQAGPLTFDLDADPFLYDGESIEEIDGVKQHEKGGKFVFNLGEVVTHLTETQKTAYGQGGGAWLKEVQKLSGFNATFVDCLYRNQDNPVVAAFLTPLRGQALFATKTVLRDSGGHRCVRYLFFDGRRWDRRGLDLRNVWFSYFPALRPAS